MGGRIIGAITTTTGDRRIGGRLAGPLSSPSVAFGGAPVTGLRASGKK